MDAHLQKYKKIAEALEAENALLREKLFAQGASFTHVMHNVSQIAVQGYRSDGTVFYWNKASEEVYGYSASEAIGKNIIDLIIPDEMRQLVIMRFDAIGRGGSIPSAEELVLKNKKGESIYVYSHHTLISNQQEEISLYCIDVLIKDKIAAERIIKEQSRQNEIMAELGSQLIEVNQTDEVFSFLGQSLQKLLFDTNTILFITEFLPDGEYLKVKTTKGMEDKTLAEILQTLDLTPENMVFKRYPGKDFNSPKLQKVQGGLDTLLKRMIPKELHEKLHGLIHHKTVYSIRILAKGSSFGSVFILTSGVDPIVESRKQVIESIVYQCAISIIETKSFLALEKELAFQQFLFEKARDGIVLLDKNHKVITANTNFCRMLGYPLADLKTMYVWDFDALLDKERILSEFATPEQVKLTFESIHKRIDGSLVEVEISVNGILWEEQESFYCSVRDVSERKKAEKKLRKSEQRFRVFFEKAPVGVLQFDKNGVVIDCNDNFLAILGSERNKVIGMHLSLVNDHNTKAMVEKVLAGQPGSLTGEYTSHTSGKKIFIQAVFTPVFDENNNVEGAIGIVDDISHQYDNQQLEKEMAVARESLIFKQNFLANMSHEIRTPLTGILGTLELLPKTGNLNEKQAELLSILRKSGESLRVIIDQVLDYSKIEAGKMKLKPMIFEFHDLLTQAQKLFTSLCNKDISFEIFIDPDTPRHLEADFNKVEQILNNYISNAVKFTSEGKISLSARTETVSDDPDQVMIKIEVSDTGTGIDTQSQKYIFQPFSQIEKKDIRQFEGTGLGLSISREMAILLGGQAGFSSEPAKGSSFWFTFLAKIPKEKPGHTPYEAPLQRSETVRNLNILFAEDKVINQKVIKLMLNSLGHSVTIAQDGRQAVELFVENLFDLILMDIQMPEMDGITATRELRSNFANLPPVVGLSANAFEGDREKYMSQGLDDYLTKPIRVDDFNKLLYRLFHPDASL